MTRGGGALLDAVLARTATGEGPARVARSLGVDVGLVEVVLDHAARTGRLPLAPAVATCGTCTPRPACAGCPVASRPA